MALMLATPAFAEVNANWMPRIVSVIRQEPKVQQEPVDKAPKVLQVDAPKQEAPKPQQAPKQEEAPKKQQEKYATCAEATSKVQGYTFVQQALAQCPELQAMQQDPNVAKTFFVPSDKAIKNLAEYARMPVDKLASPAFRGIMCNMLKYHVVDGVHLKKTWTVGQKLPTMYNGAELTVTAVGQQPVVTTTTGVNANIKRVLFCGNSVVFGTDAVLTPIKVPRLGRHH